MTYNRLPIFFIGLGALCGAVFTVLCFAHPSLTEVEALYRWWPLAMDSAFLMLVGSAIRWEVRR